MGKNDQKGISGRGSVSEYINLILFLLLFALIPTSPLWIWYLQPNLDWQIRVVDKTVPYPNYREHDALFWFLNHVKTSPFPYTRPWTDSRDYVGYYPHRLALDGKAISRFYINRLEYLKKIELEPELLEMPTPPPKKPISDFKLKKKGEEVPLETVEEERAVTREEVLAKNFYITEIEYEAETLNYGYYRGGLDEFGQPTGDFIQKSKNGQTVVIGETLKPAHVVDKDILYLADLYGAYVDDYIYPEDYISHLDYSKVIFGGLDVPEVEVIENFVARGGILIAEFNAFASPTHGEARDRLEKVLGLEWTEWAGRYFKDLSDVTEVPVWARRNWMKHYQEEWKFEGPGWLFTHEDTRLFVLQDELDVGREGLWITDVDTDDMMMQGVLSNVPFRFWFDVLEVPETTDVLAWYKIDVKPSGKKIMDRFNVPDKFPAVVRGNQSPLCMYFAGDFSDNDIPGRGPYFLAGWPYFKRFARIIERNLDQRAFFWEFYIPMLKNVFEKATH